MTLGEKIKKLMENKKLTRNQLSKQISISESTLFKIETGGIKKPSFENISEIANALNISLDSLLK